MTGHRIPPLDSISGDPDRPWTHHDADLGGVRLHYVERGEGPLVVLLHGFPEFWYSWRYQIPALADAGFRVVAPSMRGYGRSSRPEGVHTYRLHHLVDDVEVFVRHLGHERAAVVGHDWGGVVAWALAARRPEVVERLVVLNAPHPSAYRHALFRSDQLLRSWYVFLFQLPWLPERIFRAYDYEMVERIHRRDIRRDDVLEETDFMAYAEALSQPGALTAMVNYYRATFRSAVKRLLPGRSARDEEPAVVEVPTLVVWGERDRYLSPALLEGLDRWASSLWVERLPGVGHWVQQEAWEDVNRTLLWFLGPEGPGGPASGPDGAADDHDDGETAGAPGA